MKKFKKIALIVFAVFFVLLAAVIAAPFIFKKQIAAAVKEEINKNINAKVDYGNVSLSLLRNFPNFTLGLNDLSIEGKGVFKNQNLLKVKNLGVVIDIMSVINKEKLRVNGIHVNNADLNLLMLEDGTANWDIVDTKESASKDKNNENVEMLIKKIQLNGVNLQYADLSAKSFAEVKNLNFSGSGDFAKDVFTFNTKTEIDELSYASSAVTYLKKAKIDLKADLDIDQRTNKYTFGENRLEINDLGINFKGNTVLNDKFTLLDLTFDGDKTSLKNILSLVPGIYKKGFSDIEANGDVKLSGYIKGKMVDDLLPSFLLNLDINKGNFKYPDAPTAINNINLKGKVTNVGGSADNTVVDIPQFHLEVGKEPLDGSLMVKNPVSDADIQLAVKGKLDLSKVPDFYPIDGLKKLKGQMTADVNAHTRQSAIEKADYQNIQSKGYINIIGFEYESDNMDWPIEIADMELLFNPKDVDLKSFKGKIGKSDLNASGSLKNFLPFVLMNEKLDGNISLNSNTFDLNEIMAKNEQAAQTTNKETAEEDAFRLPENIALNATVNAKKVLYDDMTFENLSGNMIMDNQLARLNNLTANLLGGQVKLSGYYDSKPSIPKTSFQMGLNQFDFKKSFDQFNAIQSLTPIVKYLTGNFSADANLTTNLGNDMAPDFNSLDGTVKVSIPYAKVVNLPLINEIAQVTKLSQLQNLEVKNAWTVLNVKQGTVFVEPFDIKYSDFNMNIKGSNKLDKSINYTIRLDVPKDKLGAASSVAENMLAKVPIPGLNGMLPSVLSFHLGVGGTLDKPKVSLLKVDGSGSSGASIQEQAKDVVNEQINNAKEEITNRAQEEVDKAKEQAQKEIDKAKKEAEQKAKEEAEKAKQQIKDKIKFPW